MSKLSITKEHREAGLITRKEAGDLLWVNETVISYYASKGYIKKHYVFGNNHHYLVSKAEIQEQVKLIPQRIEARKPALRAHALSQKKDARGWFMKSN